MWTRGSKFVRKFIFGLILRVSMMNQVKWQIYFNVSVCEACCTVVRGALLSRRKRFVVVGKSIALLLITNYNNNH